MPPRESVFRIKAKHMITKQVSKQLDEIDCKCEGRCLLEKESEKDCV